MSGGVIDYWCNAFTPDRERVWHAALESQGLKIRLGGAARDGFANASDMVARMDAAGVETLVLPTCELPPGAGPTDFESVATRPDELASLRSDAPGRFEGAWSFDPRTGSAGLARAREALDAGAVALHLHTHSYDLRFDAAEQYPFYALAAEYGVAVVMQAGTSGGLMPSECGQPIGIDRPALYFPEVSFVLSHLGWPWVDEAAAMAVKFPNVFLGTATWAPRHWPPAVVDFVRGPGARKVCFGSGFPLVSHADAIAEVRALDLGEAENAVLHGNIRGLLGRGNS